MTESARREEKPNPEGGAPLGKGPFRLPNRQPIALIDDDTNVRSAVKRVLDTMDFLVSPFASAEDFLAFVPEGDFHCLLIDIQLRGMSGLELYLRLVSEARAVPIVFISASPDAVRSVRATAGPDSEILLKPLDAELLRATIKRAMRQQVRV